VAATPADDLREKVGRYLRSHHTMTLATMGPLVTGTAAQTALPHAASVFYAVDGKLRLIFLSSLTSTHSIHIGPLASVAVTVTEQYEDWGQIQGVQLWGKAERLEGAARMAALAVYFLRFPFVPELMEQPKLAESVRNVALYRVEPERVAFTDNTTGVFGREVFDLKE
jgi:uncharacterized protein YhbP (UPF0306 family)